MGAATSILYAKMDPNIKGLIVDSTFCDLKYSILKMHFKIYFKNIMI